MRLASPVFGRMLKMPALVPRSLDQNLVTTTVGVSQVFAVPRTLELKSALDQQESHDNEEKFLGEVLHSSELDDAELEGKTVLIVGSGASGVEAAETALEQGAKKAIVIARQDKVRWLGSTRQHMH